MFGTHSIIFIDLEFGLKLLEVARHGCSEMRDPDGVLLAGVRRRRVDVRAATELRNLDQTLEFWSVHDGHQKPSEAQKDSKNSKLIKKGSMVTLGDDISRAAEIRNLTEVSTKPLCQTSETIRRFHGCL